MAKKFNPEDHPHLHVSNHPVVKHKLTLLRDKDTPTSDFRRLTRELVPFLAYEVTADLPVTKVEIKTPLEKMWGDRLSGKKLALVSVLRSGNAFEETMADLLPGARVGFIGLRRNHETLEPEEYLRNLPRDLGSRKIIVLDPMLATGGSASAAVAFVKAAGGKDIRFLSLIAAPEGIARMEKDHPDVELYTAAVDRQLNKKGYIMPGIGDMGDRYYGTKPEPAPAPVKKGPRR
jgi:uracil phosphoribosyltransferase